MPSFSIGVKSESLGCLGDFGGGTSFPSLCRVIRRESLYAGKKAIDFGRYKIRVDIENLETDKVFEKMERLRLDKNWTIYYLCKEAGISHSTFHNWRKRKTLPKLDVLSKLCDVLQISLPELLFDMDVLDLSAEQKRVLEMFTALNREQKDLIVLTMQNLLKG